MAPIIKIIALSNVFTRMMHFVNKGDIEEGHKHTYDHATLVSSGSVQIDVLDDLKNVVDTNTFSAPTMIYIKKENYHRITALEDNTVCGCIHAIRTINEEIVDPEFLITSAILNNRDQVNKLVDLRYNRKMLPLDIDKVRELNEF